MKFQPILLSTVKRGSHWKASFCTASSSSSGSTKSNSSESRSPDSYREKILERALHYVPEHGWNDECLALATRDLNLPTISHRIVRRGSPELVEYFMEKKRQHVSQTLVTSPLHNVPTEDFNEHQLRLALEEHFKYIQPYKKHWPEAIAVTLDPLELPYTVKSMYSLVDDLCHIAEIKASRLNWYSERGLLFYLYGTTELFYLTDETEDLAETK
jgi:ubiquinone biosynthesis protein COQ9